jgi:hypothetical protein
VVAVLVVQHVPTEGPCAIGVALEAAGLELRVYRVWAGDVLPRDLSGVEALVVPGGPMSAYSDDGFPTRQAELGLLRTDHALLAQADRAVGPNALLPYRENPPDRVIGEDDQCGVARMSARSRPRAVSAGFLCGGGRGGGRW